MLDLYCIIFCLIFGLPEIIPGRFLKIDRVDNLVNRKYYITRVTHRFDGSGFLTEIETEGWE